MERDAKIRVVDDLSSGKRGNIERYLDNNRMEFIQADLKESGVAREAMKHIRVIFYLAADHGRRGYVVLHQAGPASNLFLDGLVFWEALKAKVEKVVFASSGCVYPNYLLGSRRCFLRMACDEPLIGIFPPRNATKPAEN